MEKRKEDEEDIGRQDLQRAASTSSSLLEQPQQQPQQQQQHQLCLYNVYAPPEYHCALPSFWLEFAEPHGLQEKKEEENEEKTCCEEEPPPLPAACRGMIKMVKAGQGSNFHLQKKVCGASGKLKSKT